MHVWRYRISFISYDKTLIINIFGSVLLHTSNNVKLDAKLTLNTINREAKFSIVVGSGSEDALIGVNFNPCS